MFLENQFDIPKIDTDRVEQIKKEIFGSGRWVCPGLIFKNL